MNIQLSAGMKSWGQNKNLYIKAKPLQCNNTCLSTHQMFYKYLGITVRPTESD